MGVLILFLLATAAGILSTLFWIDEEDLGKGYFQTHALVLLGLLGIALAVERWHPISPFGVPGTTGRASLLIAFLAAFAYHGFVLRSRWRTARAAAAVGLAGCFLALLDAGSHLATAAPLLPHRQLLLFSGLVASALVLGWSLVAMLLGHWYLVAHRLTFRHLVVFCWVLLLLIIGRLLVVGATISQALRVDDLVEPHPWRLVASLEGQGMFFWFRLLWGLAVPALLAAMALHCARRRSNQSATGILYVLVVGSFIGEITALYLTVTTGIPV